MVVEDSGVVVRLSVQGHGESRQGADGRKRAIGLEINLGGAAKVFWGASLIASSWRYGKGYWQARVDFGGFQNTPLYILGREGAVYCAFELGWWLYYAMVFIIFYVYLLKT